MRHWSFLAFGLLSAVWSAGVSSAAADTGAFDGTWSVTLACPQSPDGALPFTWVFAAEVRDAMLHGEHGQKDWPGWLTLDGRIGPDGGANLEARGVTGNAAYNTNQTARGVPYMHPVTAHFDAAQGTGTWTTDRICDFTLTRT